MGFFGTVNSCISRACRILLSLFEIGLRASTISPAWPGMCLRCFFIGTASCAERLSSMITSMWASASYEGGSCDETVKKRGQIGRKDVGRIHSFVQML